MCVCVCVCVCVWCVCVCLLHTHHTHLSLVKAVDSLRCADLSQNVTFLTEADQNLMNLNVYFFSADDLYFVNVDRFSFFSLIIIIIIIIIIISEALKSGRWFDPGLMQFVTGLLCSFSLTALIVSRTSDSTVHVLLSPDQFTGLSEHMSLCDAFNVPDNLL